MHNDAGRTAEDDQFFGVFRPLFGLVVAWVTGLLVVGGSLFVMVTAHGPLATSTANRVSTVLFCAAVTWLLWRLGGVSATPDSEHLVVRNVIYTRSLAWAQVVSVRFGAADSWVRLDLADGSTLAVMGIQRADGARGVRESRRLAGLVALLGEAADP